MTVYFKRHADAVRWAQKNRRDGVIRYDASKKMYGIYTL